MDSATLSEQIKWQAQRVAVAFGVKKFMAYEWDGCFHFRGHHEQELSSCAFSGLSGDLLSLNLYLGNEFCRLKRDGPAPQRGWNTHLYADYVLREKMVRSLYRLGFEDETVLNELNYPLTSHEKLELRLSLPREFWPQKWLNETSAD